VRDLPVVSSSWREEIGFSEFLKRGGLVAIAEIDTRKLTRIVREKGAQSSCIVTGDIDQAIALDHARGFPGLAGMDLAKIVTVPESYQWGMGRRWPRPGPATGNKVEKFHVVAFDFGIKRSILRLFVEYGCRVTVVPAQTTADEVLAMSPDGVFLSNGPGDPESCNYAIQAIKSILQSCVPVLGICLGHQLLALASGAHTVKMKFGHHGANHPVVNVDTGEVLITSQNHGFAVDETSLPDNLRATHRSLFDNSLQGVERTDCAAIGFQGHPEASPGPHDLLPMFGKFIEMMQERTND